MCAHFEATVFAGIFQIWSDGRLENNLERRLYNDVGPERVSTVRNMSSHCKIGG
jgi:hypothetical protein